MRPLVGSATDGYSQFQNNSGYYALLADSSYGLYTNGIGLNGFQVNGLKLNGLKRPKTQVLMNIGEPDMAFEQSFIPNDGVGLGEVDARLAGGREGAARE